MHGFLNDLRFAMRQLTKDAGFTSAVILTLALGLGANIALFSVLNAYLLKSLPYPDAEQLVLVDESEPKSGITHGNMSIPIYLEIGRQVSAFSASGLFQAHDFNIESQGQVARVIGAYVTPSIFDVLGVKPLLGRLFMADATDPGLHRELILSYDFWQQGFGGDRAAVGSDIAIANQTYRIVGVMPQGFAFKDRPVKLWAPMTIGPKDRAIGNVFNFSSRMIARYAPGADATAAYRQLQNIWSELGPQPAQEAKSGIVTFTLTPWRQMMVGDTSRTVRSLQAAALMLLLIACVNVSNLLLSRIVGRMHHFALRSALGASRSRLARELLIEGFCLALPAAIVGVLLGGWSLQFFSASAIGPGNGIFSIAPDWRVVAFAVAIAALAAVVVILLPIWHLTRTDLRELLQEGSRMAGGRRARRVRHALAIVELSLATVLLAGAGMLLQSLMQLQAVDPGYRLHNISLAELAVPSNEYQSPGARIAFYREVQSRISGLPGVVVVGITDVVPFSRRAHISDFDVRGRRLTNPSAYLRTVNNGFFDSLDIPLLHGRRFGTLDTATSESVVIIDQKLAGTAFPDADPVGSQIQVAGGWRTVIGVAPTIKIFSLSQAVGRGTAYLPLAQSDQEAMRGMGLTIESSIPPTSLFASLRNTIHELDPTVALYGLKPLQVRLSETLDGVRKTRNLVLLFGGIALALAAIGIYSVLNYGVQQRTTECGVRLALGAEPEDLLWLILRDGIVLLATGLAVGLGLAVTLGYVVSSELYGVKPIDPATLTGVTVVLTVVTLSASYFPARRASMLDPATAIAE